MTVGTMDGKAASTAEHPPVIVVEQVEQCLYKFRLHYLRQEGCLFVGLELTSLSLSVIFQLGLAGLRQNY